MLQGDTQGAGQGYESQDLKGGQHAVEERGVGGEQCSRQMSQPLLRPAGKKELGHTRN